MCGEFALTGIEDLYRGSMVRFVKSLIGPCHSNRGWENTKINTGRSRRKWLESVKKDLRVMIRNRDGLLCIEFETNRNEDQGSPWVVGE